MDALALDFYGARVRLESRDTPTLEALRRDFEFFLDDAGRDDESAIRWTLERRAAAGGETPGGVPGLWTPRYAAFDAPGRRSVLYADGARAVYDYRARRGRLYCADADRLRELAYLAVLSRVGQALDERGLHRVHALGFEAGGRGGLLLMPSGGGKSVLALALLRESGVNVASDDSPLVCRRCLMVHPFPLRLGFREDADLTGVPADLIRGFRRSRFPPKRLVDVGFFRARAAASVPAAWLLLGRRGAAPAVAPAGRAAALAALAEGLVIGRGLAQMAEYMARPTVFAAAGLAAIAASRARAAAALAARVPAFVLTLGPDSAANARLVASFTGASGARVAAR